MRKTRSNTAGIQVGVEHLGNMRQTHDLVVVVVAGCLSPRGVW